MTIKDDNLRAIDHAYLTARERRAQRFLDTASPAERARTLESHLLRKPSRKAQDLRDDVDDLLRYYSVLELASITGAIRELPAATRETALRNLNDADLRRYYERYYPQLLPQLFRARVSGDPALTADADCTEDFLRFVALDASRDDDEIATFLGFLDDYRYVIDEETHDLSSVVRTIAHPKRFLAALSVDNEDRTPTDEGVVGFLRFLSFSRDLDHLLRDVDSPVVRSCFWHYYGYWYQELGGQVLGALLTGINILGAYVPSAATNAAEERALARTHADMAAAVASLHLLTSSVFRVRLEEQVYGALPLRAKGPDAASVHTHAEASDADTRELREEADHVTVPYAAPRSTPFPSVGTPAAVRPPRAVPAARRHGSVIGVATEALQILAPAVAYEKSIDVDRVYKALEDALSTAARKYYKTREPLEAELDRTTGTVTIWVIKEIVEDENEIEDPQAQWTLAQARTVDPKAEVGGRLRLSYITKEVVHVVHDPHTQIRADEALKIDPNLEQGDEVKIPLTTPPDELGRIAAQSAKQVLYQEVREAEREKVYKEFADKVGELWLGYVKRFERGDMIVDLNGIEGVLPRSQQSHAERFSAGDRVMAIIIDVHTQRKGPQVVLSRTDPRLLIKLFEMEVPEISEGTVVIKGAVREPGERAKIAVRSREGDVDAVGALVGLHGSRVQSVIRELRGEKIDIVPWDNDIVVYAQNALAPAKITRVSVASDDAAHRPHLDVIVNNDELALAIGKRGLNVRLAAELLGAKIDIKSEEEVKGEVADALAAMLQEAIAESRATSVHDIEDMPAAWADKLEDAGYDDLDSIVNASAEDLTAIEGVDEDMATEIIQRALRHKRTEEEEFGEESDDDDDEEDGDEIEEDDRAHAHSEVEVEDEI